MGYIVVDIRRLHTPPMKSEDETTTIRTSEVEVIKHRIYEVRGEYLAIPDVELPK